MRQVCRIGCGVGDGVIISGLVVVRIAHIEGNRVGLLIEAPESVSVVDEALYQRVRSAWDAKAERAEQIDALH